MTLPTITQDIIDLTPGDELILRFRTWDDYEDLLARRLDKSGLRIRYSSAKPEDYQAIALRELWIYRRSCLLIYLFDGQGYQESQNSYDFPDFNVKKIIPEYVERGWQVGSSISLREFEIFLKGLNQ